MKISNSQTSGKISRAEDGPLDSPIFLTGFARSGTTWVNALFREYLNAGFVNEGQFIISFGRRLAQYGNLSLRPNHQNLLRDLHDDPFFSILERNYRVEIDWQQVAAVAPRFPAIVKEILTQVAKQTRTTRIGSKYPGFGRYLGLVNQLFPSCRVVHVIRDGRDCALSHKHMAWGHQNIYAAAVHWRDYVQGVRESALAMSGRYLEVRYEDLLVDPRRSMARLERFVAGGPAGAATERFMRDAKELRLDKIAGWRKAMSSHDQALFEGVAGEALGGAGYPLTGKARRPLMLHRGLYAVHDRLSREGWYWARRAFPSISERK